jgi:hypothetical protein
VPRWPTRPDPRQARHLRHSPGRLGAVPSSDHSHPIPPQISHRTSTGGRSCADDALTEGVWQPRASPPYVISPLRAWISLKLGRAPGSAAAAGAADDRHVPQRAGRNRGQPVALVISLAITAVVLHDCSSPLGSPPLPVSGPLVSRRPRSADRRIATPVRTPRMRVSASSRCLAGRSCRAARSRLCR